MSQRELALLGDVKRNGKPVPMDLVKLCKNKQESIQLCIKWSAVQPAVLCQILGLNKGNLSRMMSGSVNLPHNLENKLQDECGNEAILDWCNWSRNKKAIPVDNTEKIAALEAELERVKAVA